MSAIGYVTIGAADGRKSGAFYDAVFAALGSERKFDKGGWLGYGAIGPGFRPPEAQNGFFAAYLRDPTGNKLCIFCSV
jgi:catechol 2,3-dioxygenase-like lactoylglutathione lyase family enzyme